MIPRSALDPLVELAEATLTMTVQLQEEVSVRGPGMQYTKTWVDFGEPQPCLLVPASAGGTNIRADQPSVAGEWELKLKRTAVVNDSMRAVVSGEDEEEQAWTRTVALRKVLRPQEHEILRSALAVDVEANPDAAMESSRSGESRNDRKSQTVSKDRAAARARRDAGVDAQGAGDRVESLSVRPRRARRFSHD
jgi:hypothetical protein